MRCGRYLAASGFLLAIAEPACAAPAPRRYDLDLPAAPLAEALPGFAAATGLAIGWPGTLPAVRVPAVRGRLTARAALRRMLARSGFDAVQVGPTAYRIEPAPMPPPRRPVRPVAEATAPPPVPAPDIIVTGQKRPQRLREAPLSITVFDPATSSAGRTIPGTRDVAASVEGLALTNLGPGRNRQFIRGVADSPFNGPSQSTVAVQLDEARVTFDAPDPDIRLIDMERVEILKGPQGPLYGSGAIGGIYHLTTRKPDLASAGGSARISGETVAHGGFGGSLNAMLNLPLDDGRLAVRAVGYLGREPGWIDNVGRNADANRTNVGGARLALRWRPAPAWTIDLSGLLQDVTSRDSQYVTASADTLKRTAAFAEPTDNDFKTVAATVKGRLGAFDLTVASSYVRHQVDTVLDSSAMSAAFGFSGATRFGDDRHFSLVNHEVRIASKSRLRWLAGLSYLDARSRSEGTISDDTRSLVAERLDRRVHEIAAFGEATLPIAAKVSATAGARLFRTEADDEVAEQTTGRSDRIGKTILSPSIALTWAPRERLFAFLRYARAVRPGGLAPSGQSLSSRFDADELGSVDLGVRYESPDHRLSATGSLFHSDWRDIQTDYLLPNGLVSTRNAGRGAVYGAEASADWRLRPDLTLSSGLAFTDARLVRDDTGLELDDRRLPVTPALTARAAATYRVALAGGMLGASARVRYVGRSRLSFDPSLDRKMGDYATLGLGLAFDRAAFTAALSLDNVADVRGDTFAFGNPFSIGSLRQYTPNRPRSLSVSLARRW